MRHLLETILAVLLATVLVSTTVALADDEDNPNTQTMRVMGGSAVGRGEFPSMVALHYKGPNAGTPQGQACGATVIAPRWALTAAHCVTSLLSNGRIEVHQPSTLVLAEPRDLGTQLRQDGVRLISLERIIVHPGYTLVTQTLEGRMDAVAAPYDVALLRLNAPSDRPSQILAGEADRSVLEQPGRGATLVGFGQVLAGRPPSEQLLRTSLPVVDVETCRAQRKGLVPNVEQLIGPSQFCAGLKGGTADACHGDSGGPLFVRGATGSVVQVGVVSIGPDCVGTVIGYGSYASVAAASRWIAAQVPEASFTKGETQPVNAPPPPAIQPLPGPPPSALPRVDRLSESLGTTPGVDPARTAQVTIDIREGARLRIGSTASFRVVSSVAGLLVVLVRDPAGRWTQFFPNGTTGRWMPMQAAFLNRAGQALPMIRAGQTMVLAGPGDSIDAVVEPPAGEGLLVALVFPATDASVRLITDHVGTDPIGDPQAYLAALGSAVQSARAMTPERLPVNTAMGERHFTVLP